MKMTFPECKRDMMVRFKVRLTKLHTNKLDPNTAFYRVSLLEEPKKGTFRHDLNDAIETGKELREAANLARAAKLGGVE